MGGLGVRNKMETVMVAGVKIQNGDKWYGNENMEWGQEWYGNKSVEWGWGSMGMGMGIWNRDADWGCAEMRIWNGDK